MLNDDVVGLVESRWTIQEDCIEREVDEVPTGIRIHTFRDCFEGVSGLVRTGTLTVFSTGIVLRVCANHRVRVRRTEL